MPMTPARIIFQKSAIEYLYIDVSYDGGLAYTGRILLDHYRLRSKVEELISLGQLLYIGHEIGEAHHVFDVNEKVCSFRIRDDQATGSVNNAKSITAYDSVPRLAHNYMYYSNDKWYYANDSGWYDLLSREFPRADVSV